MLDLGPPPIWTPPRPAIIGRVSDIAAPLAAGIFASPIFESPVFGGGIAFSPLNLPNIVAWYDFSDLATLWTTSAKAAHVASDADPIGYVQNKANPGTYDLQQATAGNRPLWQSGSGYPYCNFVSSDTLAYAGGAVPCSSVIMGFYVGATADSSAGLVTNISDQGTNGDFAFTRVTTFDAFDSTQAAGGGLFDATHIWVNQVQTIFYTASARQVASGDATNFPATAQLQTGLLLGSDRAIAGRYLVGRIYELIICSTVQSQGNRNLAERWTAAKCNIGF